MMVTALISVARRETSDAARMAKSGHVSADPAGSAMGSGHYDPSPRDRGKLGAGLQAELLEQVGEGAALDDAVELGLVAAHEADAVDVDVVDGPATVRAVHPVLEPELGALRRHYAGLHRGFFTVDLLAEIGKGLARALLDPAQLRIGDEGAEEE